LYVATTLLIGEMYMANNCLSVCAAYGSR